MSHDQNAAIAALATKVTLLSGEVTRQTQPKPTVIKYFEYLHLPEHLQAISKPLYQLAQFVDQHLPDGPEKSTGLRKLLEAKDCLVREAVGLSHISGAFMTFGEALEALKQGYKVARSGWNGKDQYVVAQGESKQIESAYIWNQHNKAYAEKIGGFIDVAPYCTLKTAQDTLAMGWTPSTGDLFANDWVVVA